MQIFHGRRVSLSGPSRPRVSGRKLCSKDVREDAVGDPYYSTFARYNAWANARLYGACARLPESEYLKPRASFFGSIHATLNHLMVADRIWLGRIEGRPEKLALSQILYGDFTALQVARVAEDDRLIRVIDGL